MIDYFKGKKVLVTGAAGFIGTNICFELLERGAMVTGIWHNKKPVITNENFRAVQADLTSRWQCEKVICGVDYVIMAAAYVGGQRHCCLFP